MLQLDIQHFARLLPILLGQGLPVEMPHILHLIRDLLQLVTISSMKLVNVSARRKVARMKLVEESELKRALDNVVSNGPPDRVVYFEGI